MNTLTAIPTDLPTAHSGTPPTEDNEHLSLHTRALLMEARITRRNLIATDPTRPHTGEWLRYADGTMKRIAHVWEWGDGPELIQPASDVGSFFLSITQGSAQMSGGLNSGIKPHLLTLSDDTHGAWFWLWKDGRARAHNGEDVRITVRVWDVAAPIAP